MNQKPSTQSGVSFRLPFSSARKTTSDAFVAGEERGDGGLERGADSAEEVVRKDEAVLREYRRALKLSKHSSAC